MFKKIMKWIFHYGKKPSAIYNSVAPLSWANAENLMAQGYRVSRFMWPKNHYVEYNSINKCYELFDNGVLLDGDWHYSNADYVSCDWIIIGKK